MWQTLSRRSLLERGKWLTVEEHKVQLPSGQVIPDWTYVRSPSFINVACRQTDGRWVVIHQPKYAIGFTFNKNAWAPVGGYIESGEEPLVAAKRELLEEVGYKASDTNWTLLSSGVADANRGSGIGYLFFADSAEFVGKSGTSDDLEEQRIGLISTDELERRLLDSDVPVHSWAATFSMALVVHYRRQRTQTRS